MSFRGIKSPRGRGPGLDLSVWTKALDAEEQAGGEFKRQVEASLKGDTIMSTSFVDEEFLPREPGDSFPGIKDRLITLIRIQGKDIGFSTSVSGKHDLLNHNPSKATYLAVWTGEYHSDVFAVSPRLRERWAEQSAPGPRRQANADNTPRGLKK